MTYTLYWLRRQILHNIKLEMVKKMFIQFLPRKEDTRYYYIKVYCYITPPVRHNITNVCDSLGNRLWYKQY